MAEGQTPFLYAVSLLAMLLCLAALHAGDALTDRALGLPCEPRVSPCAAEEAGKAGKGLASGRAEASGHPAAGVWRSQKPACSRACQGRKADALTDRNALSIMKHIL